MRVLTKGGGDRKRTHVLLDREDQKRDSQSPPRLQLRSVPEQIPQVNPRVRLLQLNGIQNLLLLALHRLRIQRLPMQPRQHVVTLFRLPSRIIPAWRVGKRDHAAKRHEREQRLQRDGNSPRSLVVHLHEAKVQPIRQRDTVDEVDALFCDFRPSFAPCGAHLAHVRWYGA